MDLMALRVAARWAAENEVPAKNRDTGRIVWILPETQKKNPGKFQKPDYSEDPTKKKEPSGRRDRGPERARIPVDPPPAPKKPPEPPKLPVAPTPPKPVPQLKPPKVPESSPHRKYQPENSNRRTR